jgi:hypothetical protein
MSTTKMKSSAEPPQHLEKTVSYESSQAEMGKIHKKPARNTVDAELAAVLEMVRRSLSSRGGEKSLTTELFPSAGNRARRHHRRGEQAPERTRQQACPQHHARHLLLAGAFIFITDRFDDKVRAPTRNARSQSLDKGTLSFASIMNLIPDTGLVGQQYSWLTTVRPTRLSLVCRSAPDCFRLSLVQIFYLAILINEPLMGYLVQRLPIAKLLSVRFSP